MTEQPYTPSIEEVARWWANNPNVAPEFRQPSFDRMLAAHDAEVRASEREDCDGCALLEKDVAQFVAERDAAVARAEAAESDLAEYEKLATERFNALADQDVQMEALAAKLEKVREEANREREYSEHWMWLSGVREILDADPSTILAERASELRGQ